MQGAVIGVAGVAGVADCGRTTFLRRVKNRVMESAIEVSRRIMGVQIPPASIKVASTINAMS